MAGTLRYVTANRMRFAFLEEGKGELILLLHGFPDTPHTWSQVQPRLAAAGHRVVAPFMRGYPPSEISATGDYSAIELANDVLALISELGEERAVVVGHDWGALAAYAAANLAPQRLRKLVVLSIPHPASLGPVSLLSSWHFVTFQLQRRAAARLRQNDFAGLREIYRRWSPTWEVPEEELAPVKASLAAAGGLEGALGYYASFRRDALSLRGNARRLLRSPVRVPTLAFFGAEDGALDSSGLATQHCHFLNGYQQAVFAGVGHFVHREAPGPFLERLLPFVAAPG